MILIVENNVLFREALKEMLQMEFPSLSIEEATDVLEALRKVRATFPGLVLMDVKLPGTNELEITKKIKSFHSSTVVASLTSIDLPEYGDAAYRSSASYFLTKCMATGDEIEALVLSVIAGSQARISPARDQSI